MSYHDRGSPNGFGGRSNGHGGHHLRPRIPQTGSPLGPPPPDGGRRVRFAPTPQSPATPNGYQLPSPATVAGAVSRPLGRARPTTLERPPSPMPQPASPLYHHHPDNGYRIADNVLRDHGGDDDRVAELEQLPPDLQFLNPVELQEQEDRYQSRRRYASESGAGNKSSISGMLNNFSQALGKSKKQTLSILPKFQVSYLYSSPG